MTKHSAIGLLVFVPFILVACQSVHKPPEHRHPPEPATIPENTLYTDMTTYARTWDAVLHLAMTVCQRPAGSRLPLCQALMANISEAGSKGLTNAD